MDDIRLALIFSLTADDNFKFYSASLVKKVSRTKFKVLTGDFASTDEMIFYTLSGKPAFIFDNEQELRVKDFDKYCSFGIYILNPNNIKEYSKRFNLDRKNTLYHIIRNSTNLSLLNGYEEDQSYYSYHMNKDHDLSDNEIENMLFKQGTINLSKDDLDLLTRFIEEVINKSEKQIEKIATEEKNRKINIENQISSENVRNMINMISKRIIGQEDAIKTLVTNICLNQLLFNSLENMTNKNIKNELDSRKQTILLDGSTGTGKTAIAKEIGAKLKLPIVIENANSYSETGYVGPTITDILVKLYKKSNGDIIKAQRGIVFLDEVDKIAVADSDSKSMKLGVQQELLGFISGSTYKIKLNDNPFEKNYIEFDTSKLTFILSGAFTNLKERKMRENDKSKFGFSSSNLIDKKKEYEVTPEDYVSEGLMREFFGRIKVVATTKTYSVEDLKNILLNSEISPLKGFEKTCIMFGYNGIEYTDEFIDEICSEAYNMSTGARALQNLMSGIQDILLLDLITKKIDINKPVMLTKDLLDKYRSSKERTY